MRIAGIIADHLPCAAGVDDEVVPSVTLAGTGSVDGLTENSGPRQPTSWKCVGLALNRRSVGGVDDFGRDCRTNGRQMQGVPATPVPRVLGRSQLRLIASATATRIEEAGVSFCFSKSNMNLSKSSIVTLPFAPLGANPAKSAACKPNSSIRAFIRGDR
jgi:hypothetical protein